MKCATPAAAFLFSDVPSGSKGTPHVTPLALWSELAQATTDFRVRLEAAHAVALGGSDPRAEVLDELEGLLARVGEAMGRVRR